MSAKRKLSSLRVSALEKRRGKERAIAEVMNDAADQDDPDSKGAQDLLDKHMVKVMQTLMVFTYGMICTLSVFALAFYLFDIFYSTFDGSFDAYIDYVLFGVVALTLIGSVFGCCLTYKFGTIGSNIDRFSERTSALRKKVEGFTQVQQQLHAEVGNLKGTVTGVEKNKDNLLATAEQFATLSETLHDDSRGNNEFALMMDEMHDSLWEEYEKIKMEAEKADILKLFYDKQDLDDDQAGLSKREFEWLMFDLDEEVQKLFPSFEEMDEDGNGNIDVLEFEKYLDVVYKKIWKKRERSARAKAQDHYKNKNTSKKERKRYVERRRSVIQEEKHKKRSKKLLKLFK
eukprot:148492_1